MAAMVAPTGSRAGHDAHTVQFYQSDAYLLDAVSEYVRAGLGGDETVVVFATPEHRRGLAERLERSVPAFASAQTDGRYIARDAAETLAQLLADGMPDPARFGGAVQGLVLEAGSDGRPVRIFGEMVALLAVEGGPAAEQLEALWNDFLPDHSFTLRCAYPMHRLGGEAFTGLVEGICAQHGHVIPTESYTGLATDDERLRAITLLQQQAQSLELSLAAERAARKAAESALRMRDEFLSIAAHELKTPITALLGYAQFAQRRLRRDGMMEAGQIGQVLQTITGQAGRLTRLLDQLLEISRLGAGRLTLERQSLDLTALVRQVVDGGAWSDRHSLTLDLPRALDVPIDALRIEQVLTNLLDNAVKYSPDGGVIEVGLRQASSVEAELSVRDHGLGIPAERRERIFERFYQAHADGHRSGWGLGLSICRQIVELHGGRIDAAFPDDGGTRIIVRLPLDPREPSGAGPHPSFISSTTA